MRCHRRYGPERIATASRVAFSANVFAHTGAAVSGTSKQFKEIICSRFPDEFATWYRAPYKYVDELKKIAPELRVEGIEVGVPPETALVTLTYQSRDETTTAH